jgi:hypothetical protein
MARKAQSGGLGSSPATPAGAAAGAGAGTSASEAEAVAAVLHWISSPENSLPTDLKNRVVELMGAALHSPARAESFGTTLPARCLVYVHGICPHSPGFSNDWWEALHPFTTEFGEGRLDDTRREVVWSVVVHALALKAVSPGGDLIERAEFAARVRGALEERADAFLMRAGPSVASPRMARELAAPTWLEHEPDAPIDSCEAGFELPRIEIPGITCVSDFTRYLFDDAVRSKVLGVFRQVVEPLLRAGSEIDVISHSWGTVVAYEGLRALESNGGPGRVRNLFTVGAALSIVPVKQRLRPDNQNGRRPAMVRRWINLNAHGDPVGGRLQNHPFQVDVEYLDLSNLGCGFLDAACAHGSYFLPQNTAVNQGIFARFLNRAAGSS